MMHIRMAANRIDKCQRALVRNMQDPKKHMLARALAATVKYVDIRLVTPETISERNTAVTVIDMGQFMLSEGQFC